MFLQFIFVDLNRGIIFLFPISNQFDIKKCVITVIENLEQLLQRS